MTTYHGGDSRNGLLESVNAVRVQLRALDEALARAVETATEARRDVGAASPGVEDHPERWVDTAGAAKILGESPKWVSSHKSDLREALVSLPRSRTRYSVGKLEEIRRRWSRPSDGN